MTVSTSFSGSFEATQSARCTKVGNIYLFFYHWYQRFHQVNMYYLIYFDLFLQKLEAEVDLSTEVATRLNLVDRESSALSLTETQPAFITHTRHIDEDVPRLTKVRINVWFDCRVVRKCQCPLGFFFTHCCLFLKEMAAEISEALAQSDPNLVLSAAFKLRITQRDLATLQEGGWLNDEVSLLLHTIHVGPFYHFNGINCCGISSTATMHWLHTLLKWRQSSKMSMKYFYFIWYFFLLNNGFYFS